MDINNKKFLDKVVQNLTFPVSNDFEFFNITDVKEKEYILTEFFKRDFYHKFRVYVRWTSIFVSGVFFYPPNHYQPCTLLHECPINKTYVRFDYNRNGERVVSIKNGVDRPV